MSRMLKFQVAGGSNNSAARAGQPAFVNKALLAMLTVVLCASVSAQAAPVAAPAKPAGATPSASIIKAQKDPLAGDTWHADAQAGTWPGTLVFDSAKKNVTLAPVGAQPMDAAYTYTVKPSLTANVIEGTLRMTNSAKQVSESTFRIQGKVLTLMYANGQRPETYVRMTAKEEEAEKARLQKMISEGRIRPLK
jgi:hypothetical protein